MSNDKEFARLAHLFVKIYVLHSMYVYIHFAQSLDFSSICIQTHKFCFIVFLLNSEFRIRHASDFVKF